MPMFAVSVGRTLLQYAVVVVDADTADRAEVVVLGLLDADADALSAAVGWEDGDVEGTLDVVDVQASVDGAVQSAIITRLRG